MRYAGITVAIRLRYDYDTTTTYRARLLPFDTIRCEQKMNMSIFRRSRVVVVSQSNRIAITTIVIGLPLQFNSTCTRMSSANLNRKEQLQHRAVSLRQHSFLVCFGSFWLPVSFFALSYRIGLVSVDICSPCGGSASEKS